MADKLADAERYLRDFARDIDPGYVDLSGDIAMLLAEYDRRGVIVEAATEVAKLWPKVPHEATQEQLFSLLYALAATVEEREQT